MHGRNIFNKWLLSFGAWKMVFLWFLTLSMDQGFPHKKYKNNIRN